MQFVVVVCVLVRTEIEGVVARRAFSCLGHWFISTIESSIIWFQTIRWLLEFNFLVRLAWWSEYAVKLLFLVYGIQASVVSQIRFNRTFTCVSLHWRSCLVWRLGLANFVLRVQDLLLKVFYSRNERILLAWLQIISYTLNLIQIFIAPVSNLIQVIPVLVIVNLDFEGWRLLRNQVQLVLNIFQVLKINILIVFRGKRIHRWRWFLLDCLFNNSSFKSADDCLPNLWAKFNGWQRVLELLGDWWCAVYD